MDKFTRHSINSKARSNLKAETRTVDPSRQIPPPTFEFSPIATCLSSRRASVHPSTFSLQNPTPIQPNKACKANQSNKFRHPDSTPFLISMSYVWRTTPLSRKIKTKSTVMMKTFTAKTNTLHSASNLTTMTLQTYSCETNWISTLKRLLKFNKNSNLSAISKSFKLHLALKHILEVKGREKNFWLWQLRLEMVKMKQS